MQTTKAVDKLHVRGRRSTWLLSLIAFSPMGLLSILLVLSQRDNATFLPMLDAFKLISAISLSFLGGIRWGMAVGARAMRLFDLGTTMLPAMVGWVCLFLPIPLAIGGLLLAVCGMGAWDSFSFYRQKGLHDDEVNWYMNIRTVMTLLAAIAHIGVLLAVL